MIMSSSTIAVPRGVYDLMLAALKASLVVKATPEPAPEVESARDQSRSRFRDDDLWPGKLELVFLNKGHTHSWLNAVKLVRKLTGWGLRDSRLQVDNGMFIVPIHASLGISIWSAREDFESIGANVIVRNVAAEPDFQSNYLDRDF
jgi:hypothetical protein